MLQQAPATPIEPTGDGQILRLLGFGLGGFEPGYYSLTLRITDELTHESREVRESFVVVP